MKLMEFKPTTKGYNTNLLILNFDALLCLDIVKQERVLDPINGHENKFAFAVIAGTIYGVL